MAVAKRSVRDVVDDGKEERKDGKRKSERMAAQDEKDKAEKRCESYEEVAEKDAADEPGIGGAEIVEWRFGAEPCGDDAARGKTNFKSGVSADEIRGEAPFFLHEGGFAELGVAARLFETGDVLNAMDGVRIEDVVIAEPELKGKIGAQRNEAVKGGVIADRPRDATEDGDKKCERGKLPERR